MTATPAQVRRRVFIEEQGLPEHEEWMPPDPVAWHVLAIDEKCDASARAPRVQRQIGRCGAGALPRQGVGQAIMRCS